MGNWRPQLGLSEKAVRLAAGGVEGTLLLLRAVANERAAVLVNHATEPAFSEKGRSAGPVTMAPPSSQRLSTWRRMVFGESVEDARCSSRHGHEVNRHLSTQAFRFRPPRRAQHRSGANAPAASLSKPDSLRPGIHSAEEVPGSQSRSRTPAVVAICGSSSCSSILTGKRTVQVFLPYGIPDGVSAVFLGRARGYAQPQVR